MAYFPLDETNGLAAFDTAGNGHIATLFNFPNDNRQWVPGVTNGALAFNFELYATNWTDVSTNYEYAAPADPANALDFSTIVHPAFTLAAWVKGRSGDSQAPGAGIIAKGYGRGGEAYFLDLYQNHFRFFVRGGDGTGYAIQQQPLASGTINVEPASSSLISGFWQLIIGVYDSSQPSNQLKLYLDGQLVAERNGPANLFSTTHQVSIGAREDNATDGYNLPFIGTMDEVKFYNRALSSNDAQELYLAGKESSSNSPSDFDVLRLQWRDWLNGGTNLNLTDPEVAGRLASLSASAQSLWSTMNQSPTRTFLWSDLSNLGTDSSQLWNTYDRLKTLALAYMTPGTMLYGNGSLHGSLFSALDWMYANYYNENKSEYNNWWHWEIGIPLRLNDITVLLYDQLSPTQISNYMNAVNHFTPVPNPNDTAANLVWKTTVVALRGVIVKDSSKIAIARDSLSTVFPYVTSGDGFYTDGSFIQHTIYPYTGSYGSSLIYYLAPIMGLLHGSPWEITDPAQTNIFHWVYDSYEPVIYKGGMMDIVRGRAKARAEEPGHWIGHQSMNGILQLEQFAPSTDAAAFKVMLKEWIQTDTAQSFFADVDLGLIPVAKVILADTSVVPRGELVGHYNFASMDRVIHLRPNWGFALGLSSSRIANYESINGENLHGWYMGDGETYLYNSDLNQYDGNYWPTIDPYRLPGTTVDTQTRANSSGAGYRSPCTWVGGATLGDFGTAGMNLDAWNSTLVAKKSWFMFDDAVVCLGAGITSSDNRTIETIVENRKLNNTGDNAFAVNNAIQPPNLGWAANLTNISWAHLADAVPSADIGYYFPQPVSLRALRETRTGSWYNIDHLEPSTIYTNNFLTLWFDHGTNPNNVTYAYYLLPGKSAAQVAAYAAAPDAVILQNTSAIQAARDLPLGITAANFWQDGSQNVGGITVDRKTSTVLQATETNIVVAVADPTQTNTTGITVTLDQPALQIASLDSGVTLIKTNPVVKFFVSTAGAHGKSFHVTFLPAITNFSGFQNEYFTATQTTNAAISGATADPDHDGQPNLLEYALMLNPWQTDTNVLHPHLRMNGDFSLIYMQRKLAADLVYRVDVSTNLLTWDTSENQINKFVLSETSVSRTIEVTAHPSVADGHRFFRLTVLQLP